MGQCEQTAKGSNIESIEWSEPVLSSGQKLTISQADTDYTVTVAAGERYVVMNESVTASLWCGLATVATDANKLWLVPAGGKVGIVVPVGYTTLHYGGTGAAVGRLVKVFNDTQEPHE